MKIKNESELAHVMGMAFHSYCNKVQNGLTRPYKPFLEGAESVEVRIILGADGSISVESIVEEEAQTEEETTESTTEALAAVLPSVEEKPKKRRRRRAT